MGGGRHRVASLIGATRRRKNEVASNTVSLAKIIGWRIISFVASLFSLTIHDVIFCMAWDRDLISIRAFFSLEPWKEICLYEGMIRIPLMDMSSSCFGVGLGIGIPHDRSLFFLVGPTLFSPVLLMLRKAF